MRDTFDNKSVDGNTTLNANDLAALEEMDPSLSDGFKVAYDKEVPLELRLQDSTTDQQDVGTLESIRTRVLVQGEPNAPEVIKIEFTSEADLFFNYASMINEEYFLKIKDEQKLNVEFSGFLNLLLKLINNCQKEPQNFFSVFFMQRDGQARLEFIQNMEFKFLELLSLDFLAAPEELIRQNISFRYSLLKAKSQVLQTKLKDVSALLKIKNPSLLLQLQKGATSRIASQKSSLYQQREWENWTGFFFLFLFLYEPENVIIYVKEVWNQVTYFFNYITGQSPKAWSISI